MDLATITSTNLPLHHLSTPLPPPPPAPLSLPLSLPLPSSLSHIPPELLLEILTYLDIPDLLTISRTSHHLRHLSLDPLLHTHRLHRAGVAIQRYIPLRPALAELMAHRIYITRTTLAARSLGRNLIRIKLNRQLLARPSVESLVQCGVLPGECYGYGDGCVGGGARGTRSHMAPALVEVKRKVERERIKDVLRGWVEDWRRRGYEKALVPDGAGAPPQRPDVRRMARRFARDGREQLPPRWGERAKKRGSEAQAPPRAKVLGLRRFWERIGKEGGAR